jgi:hypothetical protein
MRLRAELQRMREQLLGVGTDVWANPRNRKDPARGEVATLRDPAALLEYDTRWPMGIPGGIPARNAWHYCRRTPGCLPWETLREHV